MRHFFVTIFASRGLARASVRVGPFGSAGAADEWVSGFRQSPDLCWEASEIEEEEGSPPPSHAGVAEQLRAKLSAKPANASPAWHGD